MGNEELSGDTRFYSIDPPRNTLLEELNYWKDQVERYKDPTGRWSEYEEKYSMCVTTVEHAIAVGMTWEEYKSDRPYRTVGDQCDWCHRAQARQ